jgi:hypothetical protein
MRTLTGAEHFITVRSHAATTYHGIGMLDALITAATGADRLARSACLPLGPIG